MGHKHRELIHFKGNMMGVFDTHAHLYDARFSEDDVTPEDLLERAREAGVSRILIPADSLQTSHLAVDYAISHGGKSGVELFAAVGVHPHEASAYDSTTEMELNRMLIDRKRNRIFALGEIGLDYYYDYSPRDVQCDVFTKQLKLAYDNDIPFILHEREATKDCLDILTAAYKGGYMRSNPGVCHCCSMSVESAQVLLKMGFFLGFDGPLTYKNNVKGIELAKSVPLDRIVVETDSPYLTPEPNRGRRNEPEFVPFVVERLAEIKEIDPLKMAEITTENGLKLYEIM